MRFVVLTFLLTGCQEFSLSADGNDPPQVSIVSHDYTDVFVDGEEITFRAVPSDEDNSLGSLSVGWWVDEQVACDLETPDSDGNSLCAVVITAEMTELRVEVRDPANEMGFDTLDLTVRTPNVAPDCQIISPTDGTSVPIGEAVTLIGSASDPETETDALTTTWSSDIDDVLGESPLGGDGFFSFTTSSLSDGTHALSMTVEDGEGGECTASTTLEVGEAPVVTITEPVDDSSALLDDPVPLVAGVSDDATAPPDLLLQWESSLQGDLTSSPADTSGITTGEVLDLEVGTHVLTLVATDDAGRTGEDSVTVHITECDPDATEIPYDGVDSNCDGLETLNDLNGDSIPDDDTVDYDIDDDIDTTDSVDVPARLGVECSGGLVTAPNGDSFYILTCDDDRYWSESEEFCLSIGYDGLAAHGHESVRDGHVDLIDVGMAANEAGRTAGTLDADLRFESPWVGLTRGPSCSPVTSLTTTHPEICGSDVRDYYWTLSGVDASWANDDPDLGWHPCEVQDCVTSATYLDAASGDYTTGNSVEHCAFLLVNSNGVGYFDLYCDYVNSSPHDQWSLEHTRASSCIRDA